MVSYPIINLIYHLLFTIYHSLNMRLASSVPFSPQKSVIADYAEELLPHLARRED